MNAKPICAFLLLTTAGCLWAGQGQAELDMSAPFHYSPEWKPHPEWYRGMLTEKLKYPTVTLGRTDYTLHGPVVEMFRPPKPSDADNFVDGKLRRIPILSWIVPYKMAMPPEGRAKYFRWGRSEMPWTSIAKGAAAGTAFSDAVNHRASTGLFQANW